MLGGAVGTEERRALFSQPNRYLASRARGVYDMACQAVKNSNKLSATVTLPGNVEEVCSPGRRNKSPHVVHMVRHSVLTAAEARGTAPDSDESSSIRAPRPP